MAARKKRLLGWVAIAKLTYEDGGKNAAYNFRDWTGLPDVLLEVVLKRLRLLDCVSFSKVCKSWRIVGRKHFRRRRTCGIPWLVKPGDRNVAARSCFSILEDKGYDLELPELGSWDGNYTYIWGSFRDWLVLVSVLLHRFGTPSIQICLLNPFSRTKRLLPKTWSYYGMMVPSSVPTDQNCVYMLVGKSSQRLAFWASGGAREWRIWDRSQEQYCQDALSHYRSLQPFEDAVFCKGCFYLLKGDYSILTIDVESIIETMSKKDAMTKIKKQLLPVKMPNTAKTGFRKGYLVQSCGEILLVCHLFTPGTSGAIETSGFEKYRLDLCQMTWVKLDNLRGGGGGGRILFVGKGCSRSFPAKALGDGMANCIFFTNNFPNLRSNEWDDCRSEFIIPQNSVVEDWGVFGLQDDHFSHRLKPKLQAAVWLTAPLWWYFNDR